jgi:isocitrate dehydrogenase (NAD+)
VSSVTWPRALGLGLLLSAANPKNLALTVAASASIAQAGLETGETLLADAVFVAIGSITVVGAVLFALVAPRRSVGPLERVRGFMAEHNTAIMPVAPVSFRAMAHRVTLIPGDGIGPEVAAAARIVLDAADVGIEWIERPAGTAALDDYGELMPEETLDAIRESRVALKGPITTPVGTGFRSVNVALRQGLDLFGAVRPARALPGVPIRHPSVDLVVVRENTEDLYAGIEFERGSPEAAALREELRALGGYELREDAGITVKPISVSGTRRIVRFAFEYAQRNGRKKVTVGHKANVMRYSDGLFLRTAEEESRAYPDVAWEEIQIDHLTSRLARMPGDFDVLLLPNLYGDIISDLCAGLVGGLGLIPGANIGWEYAVFEPVHGSAPDIAGQGKANPIAMILSGAMLLRHIGELAAAENVEWAVDEVLVRAEMRTSDLGGSSTTMQVAEEIAMQVTAWEPGPS